MDIYTEQLTAAEPSVVRGVAHLASHLRNVATVYLAGIGKSGLVARKSASTWQSLGLPCHFLNAPDMLHGDIGVLRPGDAIIYISNSGNTEELVQITTYIKAHKPSIQQVLVSNNPTPAAASNVDQVVTIGASKIVEADAANCAPTVSSVLFMIFLDMLGVHLAGTDGATKDIFKHNHPSGDLGKR
jgi:arabinose-5-phosphate isomerase